MKNNTTHQWIAAGLIVLVAGFLGACSQSSSPTAPSLLPGSSQSAPASSTGATIVGQVNGTSSTSSASTSKFSPQSTGGLTVTVAGTGNSTTVDSSGQFTLTNVPPGNATLQFTGPNTNATVTIGGLTAGQQITITVTVNGSSASLDSENGQGSTSNSSTELEGLIQSIDTGAGTFVVNGTTVSVSPTTSITHGSTTMQLSDLQVGWRVHVKGTMQNGELMATEVLVQNEQVQPTELSGTLSAAPTGTCPTVSFTLNGTTVTTSASTTYHGGSCSQLAAGVKVDVKGTPSPTGTISADSISMEIPEVELNGTLAAAPTGTCPTVSFTLNGTTVNTTAGTSYQNGGSCSDLVAGANVEVTGTGTTGGVVTATKISVEKPEAQDVSGTLAAAPTGTCPSISFTVNSTTVDTSASTTFSGGTCSALTAGSKVEATGVVTSGTMNATKVSIESSGGKGNGSGGNGDGSGDGGDGGGGGGI